MHIDKYADGEYSSLSPFSETAFSPKGFDYSYLSGVNFGMQNFYNSVDVYFDTGSKLVTDIEVVFKEDGNNNVYIVDSLNKKNKKYIDNTSVFINFKNNKVYKILPEKQLFRLYDNVPLRAFAQDFIDNRITYANYVENYDLVDCNQAQVQVDMDLSIESDDSPGFTMKTDRDYEVGISYLDDYGRSSTILTSENANVHNPIQNSIFSNELSLKINHIAPLFSKYYRIFLKESKDDYDSVVSPTFYTDSDYIFLLINREDKSKLQEKEFVYLKADTDGIKATKRKVKILSITDEEANFLHRGSTPPTVTENLPGTYLKIEKSPDITFNTDNFFEWTEPENAKKQLTVDISGFNNPNLSARQGTRRQVYIAPNTFVNSTESAIYYPVFSTSSAKMTANTSGSTYTTGKSKRWEIQLISSNQIRWRSKATGFFNRPDTEIFNDTGTGSWSSAVTVSSNMTLTDSEGDAIQVVFSATTGHDNQYDYAFSCLVQKEDSVLGSTIGAGTEVKFTIQEFERFLKLFGSEGRWNIPSDTIADFAREDYVNIEEFFYQNEEFSRRVYDHIGAANTIQFRRGTKTFDSNDNEQIYPEFSFTGNESDSLIMLIQSVGYDSGDIGEKVELRAGLSCVVKSSGDSKIILETEADKVNDDIFYELPGTYEVNACGYHLGIGGDITQTADKPAILSLNVYNAYSWGNGLESSKIRDSFQANKLSINTRPLAAIQDYRENHRVSSITYSDVYEQSTNYNGLNEFNLSQINYKDVDDEYGDIRRIHSRDTDLVVFQENKVSKLLVNKSVLFNADGTGNVAQNVNVLGQQVPYVGEYGISYNAHSFASWGNRMYFVDDRRSAVMRLSQDGLTEISQYGMRDWFKDEIKPKDYKNIIGGYDPYAGQYVTSIKNPLVAWLPEEYLCPRCFCAMEGYIYATAALPTTTTTTQAVTTTTAAPNTSIDTATCVSYTFRAVGGDVKVRVKTCAQGGVGKIEEHNILNGQSKQFFCIEFTPAAGINQYQVGGTGTLNADGQGACLENNDRCKEKWILRGGPGPYGVQWVWFDCTINQEHAMVQVQEGYFITVESPIKPEPGVGAFRVEALTEREFYRDDNGQYNPNSLTEQDKGKYITQP